MTSKIPLPASAQQQRGASPAVHFPDSGRESPVGLGQRHHSSVSGSTTAAQSQSNAFLNDTRRKQGKRDEVGSTTSTMRLTRRTFREI